MHVSSRSVDGMPMLVEFFDAGQLSYRYLVRPTLSTSTVLGCSTVAKCLKQDCRGCVCLSMLWFGTNDRSNGSSTAFIISDCTYSATMCTLHFVRPSCKDSVHGRDSLGQHRGPCYNTYGNNTRMGT